jgi:pimeloyl-ACP methyl ester carboxylesterase
LVGLFSALVAAWLVPVAEVVLVGLSMGGLVEQSAVHQAGERADAVVDDGDAVGVPGQPHAGGVAGARGGPGCRVLGRFDRWGRGKWPTAVRCRDLVSVGIEPLGPARR